MRIAFISSDWSYLGPTNRPAPGGACFYRCVLPAKSLSEFGGIETDCFWQMALKADTGEIVPFKYDKPSELAWDVIVLQRWADEKMVGRVREAKAAGQIVVQDVDDHFWDIHKANRASAMWKGAILEEYTASLRESDLVTVSTPYLAKVLHEHGCDNVVVLQNMIDLRMWKRQAVAPIVKNIGWVGSTAHRSGDLEQIGSSVRYFMRDYKGIGFIHGGDAHPYYERAADQLRIPHHRTTTRPLATIEEYPKLWKGIDIALCPLNPVPFNRAKSSIKAMEASAAGIPYIATRLDAYEDFNQGILVDSPTAWEGALKDLLDFDLRLALANKAHDRVRLEDCNVRWKDWQEALIPTEEVKEPPRVGATELERL